MNTQECKQMLLSSVVVIQISLFMYLQIKSKKRFLPNIKLNIDETNTETFNCQLCVPPTLTRSYITSEKS